MSSSISNVNKKIAINPKTIAAHLLYEMDSPRTNNPTNVTPILDMRFHRIFITVTVSKESDFQRIRGCREYRIIETIANPGDNAFSNIFFIIENAIISIPAIPLAMAIGIRLIYNE